MKINKVLITGVAGFIGSNLLDYLLRETNWEIVGVDNLATGNIRNINHNMDNPRFEFLQIGCNELKSLKEYDRIFHLAALPRIQPSFEYINEHIEANVLESTYLVELMIREEHFPRFVFSGSSAIYGTPENIPTKENEKVECLNPYAFQKYEVERYLELISTRYPVDFVSLRYFNPYGPRSFNPENKFNAYSSVVGIFLNRLENDQQLLITGDGCQKRDFIHVQDLASANYLAAIHPEKLNTAFNIGYGDTYSIIDVAKMISNDFEFIPKREGEADITFADNSKAKEVLQWKPTIRLEDFLSESTQKIRTRSKVI